ncbi:MAG: response regulator [Elusimicrobiales bacterium]|jgi:CheY-like chemotaxis protein|nr:response regulator [Elusimicrobiales bacterium]NLH39983.1 response regulator [Elusimicrobiota bacterium]
MKRIVCVDDDKDILETLEVILEGRGYEVFTATNGKDGVRLVKDKTPDLVIMDVMMDDFTDGFHAVYDIRKDEKTKYIPIMMLTSVNKYSDQKFSEKDGEYLPVDAFIEKPVKPKEFIKKVDELIALKKEDINVDGSKK